MSWVSKIIIMNKKFIQEQEIKLKEEKKRLEEQLSSFAKAPSEKGEDWETKMPMFNAGSGNLEEEADEVEEFSTNLALTNNLENSLSEVDLALEKIKKGEYGICEKCQKPIAQARLKIHPQARQCTKCG